MKAIQTKSALFTSILVSLAASCASTDRGDPSEVDPALLQYADEGAREAVQTARLEHAEAQDAVAAAELQLDEAKQMRELAEQQLEIVEERVELARKRVESADRENVAEAAMNTREEVDGELERAKQRVEIYDSMIAARKAGVDLAEAREELAEDRVELAKAEAVHGTDQRSVETLEIADYEAAVRSAETDVKMAELEYDGMVQEFEIKREAFEGDATKFPEMEREFEELMKSRD